MNSMSRRLVIRGSLGLAATGVLARPCIANAAGTTAVVWAGQGFVPEEDVAFRKTVADYEKASGNKIDLSIMPFMALNQKAISALTSGEVPDLVFHGAPDDPAAERLGRPAGGYERRRGDAKVQDQRNRAARLQLL
jgi:multiple sugar transport system substrate-binding protein